MFVVSERDLHPALLLAGSIHPLACNEALLNNKLAGIRIIIAPCGIPFLKLRPRLSLVRVTNGYANGHEDDNRDPNYNERDLAPFG